MTVPVATTSRPLRALWLFVFGYAAIRGSLLLLAAAPPAPIALPAIADTAPPVPAMAALAQPLVIDAAKPAQHTSKAVARSPRSAPLLRTHPASAGIATLAPISEVVADPGETVALSRPRQDDSVAPAPPAPIHSSSAPSRFSASFWAIARGEGTAAIATGGSLGGSQMGVRAWYRVTPLLSLTGKLSTSLTGPERDASIGIAARHGPGGIIVERRFGIGRAARDRTVVTAFAGIDRLKLPLGARLDGFLQAGFADRDGFADGALRIDRALAERSGWRISAGIGAWGGIQPGARRLDVGPLVSARFPLADRALRLSLEWRQRVAGNARPGSGPAATLAFDY